MAWSQTSEPTEVRVFSAAEPGKALAEGIRLYRRGEFEKASDAFRQAQINASKLSVQDQRVLRDYVDRSSRAMVAQSQARMELAEAEQAANARQYEKAQSLLTRVAAKSLPRTNGLAARAGNRDAGEGK